MRPNYPQYGENALARFSNNYNNCGKKLYKFLGDFLLDHYFQNKIEGVPLTRGHAPYFILG